MCYLVKPDLLFMREPSGKQSIKREGERKGEKVSTMGVTVEELSKGDGILLTFKFGGP